MAPHAFKQYFSFYLVTHAALLVATVDNMPSCKLSFILGEGVVSLSEGVFKARASIFTFKMPWRHEICLLSATTLIETISQKILAKPQQKNAKRFTSDQTLLSLKNAAFT